MRVAPSQLNSNASLMLVAFEYLCMQLSRLGPSLFSFFYFFNYSLRAYGRHIYFTQRLGIPYLFTMVSISQKGWKDTFIQVVRRSEKKKTYWITSSRKLVFLIKWSAIEKIDFKKGLNELYEENQTIVDIIIDMSQEPQDINKILDLHYT